MSKIITIGREFGSGGRELGKRLAKELNIPYYDKEIITEIAKNINLNENYVDSVFNKGINNFIYNYGHSYSNFLTYYNSTAIEILSEQRNVLHEIAKKDCVIVGRSADVILKDLKPFRIFVYASEEFKLNRCKQNKRDDENLNDKQMLKKMKEIDDGRRNLHSYLSDNKWGDKSGYDLMINTTNIVIKDVVSDVVDYVNKYFNK